VVRWMDSVKDKAEAIYLVGDVFDFWFDYGSVIPKGYTYLLAKLRELRDMNIPIFFFTGNHDMWMFSYFEDEFDIPIFRDKKELSLNGKSFLVAHGDGLGPGDKNYKRIKKIFSNKICQFLFKWLHPNIGIWIARRWSLADPKQYHGELEHFLGKEKEWLTLYDAEKKLEEKHYDYFIFGHRHIPLKLKLNDKSTFICLGDWINHFTYASYDGKEVELCYFEKDA